MKDKTGETRLVENYLRPDVMDLILICATQVMPAMQAPLSIERGILPAMSENGMESGKLGKSRLPACDNPAAVFDNSLLDFFLRRIFCLVNFHLNDS